jgi:hypothetical protein
MPKATVLAVSNLGAPILRYTPHRVLAGPYHRNVEGDLAALNAFAGTDAEAQRIVHRYGVTLVASCPGNDETRDLGHRAPDGLAARLASKDVPGWLTPLASTAGHPLGLFKVISK